MFSRSTIYNMFYVRSTRIRKDRRNNNVKWISKKTSWQTAAQFPTYPLVLQLAHDAVARRFLDTSVLIATQPVRYPGWTGLSRHLSAARTRHSDSTQLGTISHRSLKGCSLYAWSRSAQRVRSALSLRGCIPNRVSCRNGQDKWWIMALSDVGTCPCKQFQTTQRSHKGIPWLPSYVFNNRAINFERIPIRSWQVFRIIALFSITAVRVKNCYAKWNIYRIIMLQFRLGTIEIKLKMKTGNYYFLLKILQW